MVKRSFLMSIGGSLYTIYEDEAIIYNSSVGSLDTKWKLLGVEEVNSDEFSDYPCISDHFLLELIELGIVELVGSSKRNPLSFGACSSYSFNFDVATKYDMSDKGIRLDGEIVKVNAISQEDIDINKHVFSTNSLGYLSLVGLCLFWWGMLFYASLPLTFARIAEIGVNNDLLSGSIFGLTMGLISGMTLFGFYKVVKNYRRSPSILLRTKIYSFMSLASIVCMVYSLPYFLFSQGFYSYLGFVFVPIFFWLVSQDIKEPRFIKDIKHKLSNRNSILR